MSAVAVVIHRIRIRIPNSIGSHCIRERFGIGTPGSFVCVWILDGIKIAVREILGPDSIDAMDIVHPAIAVIINTVLGIRRIPPHVRRKVLMGVADTAVQHGDDDFVVGAVSRRSASIPSPGGFDVLVDLGVVVEMPAGEVCDFRVIGDTGGPDDEIRLGVINHRARGFQIFHSLGHCF